MIADEIIDSYVYDVVRLLPRRQRTDVALELRALLHDELGGGDGPAPAGAEAALTLVQRFGPPAEVAARYRAPLTIIDPIDAHRFARAAWVGGAVIVLGGLLVVVAQPGFGTDPLLALQAYWTRAWLLALTWLGFLVVCAATAASARRRRPVAPVWTPRRRHVDSDTVSRVGYAFAVLGMALGTATVVDPRLFVRAATGGAASPALLDAFTYDAAFVRQRLPVLVGLLTLKALTYAVVAVHGGWRRRTRLADIGVSLAIIAAMAWLLVAGSVYQAVETDRSLKLGLLILIVVSVPVAVTRIRRVRLHPHPA